MIAITKNIAIHLTMFLVSSKFKTKIIQHSPTQLSSVLHHSVKRCAHAKEQVPFSERYYNVAKTSSFISCVGCIKGQLNVRLVESNDKAIVNIPKTEYDAIGFDGNWNTAYSLIDPTHLKKFKATNRAAPKNARWFESQNPQSYIHLLWDEKNQFQLQVESGSLDGRLKRTVKASVQLFPATTPWTAISKFNVKEYSDFLD